MADTFPLTARPEERFVAEFERVEALHANGSGEHFPLLRQEALGHFTTLGFPPRKSESWKYTNMGSIVRRPYSVPRLSAALATGLPELEANVAVFVNGCFDAGQSTLHDLPAAVTLASFTDEMQADRVRAHLARYAEFEHEPFTALNTAFIHDGALIHVPASCLLSRPIHVIHVVTAHDAALVQPRTLVICESGAQAQIVQSTEVHGKSPVLINSVTEIRVGACAQLDHMMVQSGTPSTSCVANVSVYQETESKFYNGSFTFGGEITRNNISVLADAEHCETLMHGLFVARGKSHVDNNTLMDHAKPNCFSSEYYKGILDERATGVFNGKVLVRQDAQQINAYQTNRSIVLTDTARMYSKPALEIYADDVKCSHGATTGQLDKDGLFYLRARGIRADEARRLMLVSFAGDIIEKVPAASLHEALYREVERSLR